MYFVISMDIDTDSALGHVYPGRILALPEFQNLVANCGPIESAAHATLDEALDWVDMMYATV